MKITFITSNRVKFAIADSILKYKGISLVRNQMNLEEIQSENILDIARNSAKIAFSKIKKSVAVTDAGFYITALNGFPGPFVKYANRYFDADKLIQLMSDEPNRELIVREALVVIDDFGAEHCYQTEFYGSVVVIPPRPLKKYLFQKIVTDRLPLFQKMSSSIIGKKAVLGTSSNARIINRNGKLHIRQTSADF